MTIRSDLYGADFQSTIRANSVRSAEIAVPMIMTEVAPSSVIDIGCGTGSWLSVFRHLGLTDVTGIDGPYVPQEDLLIPVENFRSQDLGTRVSLDRRFDLAMSLEVAEHLDAARADSFVDDLCALSDNVVFSAAIPGQGGVHHVNEQWQSYWVERFEAHGYAVRDVFRHKLWTQTALEPHYAQNMFLFSKNLPPEAPLPFDLVHPAFFAGLHGHIAALSLKDSLKILPGSLMRFYRARSSRLLQRDRRG